MRKAFLLLAFSGCVAAQPPPANTGGYQEPAAPAEVHDWVALTPAVPTTDIQQVVEVGVTNRAFSQLLIKAVDGEPQIEMLEIQYMDDDLRKVDVHKRIVVGAGQVIELRQNRAIKKITVFTDPDSHGAYTIFGA